ncbi:hypothetical protein EVAR_37294_1, partial [Eumeta japonica]
MAFGRWRKMERLVHSKRARYHQRKARAGRRTSGGMSLVYAEYRRGEGGALRNPALINRLV